MAPTPRDLAELVRAPAALTVPGDALAGAAAAGFPLGPRTWLTPLASACLYWAGMALNDYADRDLDRVERPERPIPSGRVSPGQALALAAGLTGGGLALAAVAGGRRALGVAVPLAATVWAYDLLAKDTPAGPVAMATARGLDVLLGAAPAPRAAALPALAVATHTLGVTALSRGEVHGTNRAAAGGALAATATATTLATWPPSSGATATTAATAPLAVAAAGGRQRAAVAGRGRWRRLARLRDRGLPGALAAGYAATVGRAQADALRRRDADTVRRATGTGIRGMIPLQAALVARAGAPALAAALLAAGPVARAASRVVSPT